MIIPGETMVTVFGASGFIGRYVTEALAKAGVRIRAAARDPRGCYILQPLGQVGQIGAVKADIADRASAERAIADSDAVINLVGAFKDMHSIHVDGARNVAEAASSEGVGALVQISAIGADPDGASLYARTKGEGELRVQAAFPTATILRPSLVFGAEDQFTNRFAAMGWLPVIPVLAPTSRFQPVFVRDLAQAIVASALAPAVYGGETFEIGGPEVLTMIALQRRIFALSGQRPELVELPDFLGNAISRFGFLPGAPITRDQWLMLGKDNVVSGANGLDAFGIEPTPLAAVAGEWLARYRGGSRFAGRRPTAAS